MLHTLSIGELGRSLSSGEISSVELTRLFLARIERLNPALNALITLTAEQALLAAAAADRRRAAGEKGPLLGIPLIHKDIFCTDGVRTSCGSRMLDNFVAPFLQRDELLRTRQKSLGYEQSPGRIIRGVGGGGRGAPGCVHHGHRYRRVDPSACRVDRRDRCETDLWTCVSLRDDCLRIESRPGRSLCQECRGRRDRPTGHGRIRSSRFNQHRCSGSRLPRRPSGAAQGPEDRSAARVFRRLGGSQCVADRRRVEDLPRPRGGNRRSQLAAPAVVGAHLLCGRAGRVLVQSVALRRRALRLSLREPCGFEPGISMPTI